MKSNLSFFILVDVPAEFDVTSPLKEDLVDHHLIASKVECIELLRLKPLVSNILHSLPYFEQHSCPLVSQFKAFFFQLIELIRQPFL